MSESGYASSAQNGPTGDAMVIAHGSGVDKKQLEGGVSMLPVAADLSDIVQAPGGLPVTVNRSRDALLTPFGKSTLDNSYLLPDESYQDLFGRVASYYGADAAHAQRVYGYISRHWFMPATPALSNGGTTRGLPISCFLNEATDSMRGIVDLWNENVWLASKGGGIGCVDADTEFLTPGGWVRISDYKKGMEIAVPDVSGKAAKFETPERYIEGPAGLMYRLSNARTDMVVSDTHRNFVRNGHGRFVILETRDLLQRNLANIRFKPTVDLQVDTKIDMSDDELRFAVVTALLAKRYDPHEVTMAVAGKVRCEAMRGLLGRMNVPFNEHINGKLTIFKMHASHVSMVQGDLTFENFGRASNSQRALIYQELSIYGKRHAPDNYRLKIRVSTKADAEFAQYVLMSETQCVASIAEIMSGSEGYMVSVAGRSLAGISDVEPFTPDDGKQYCFTTSTGLWLARRNGFIFITGNSYWGNLRSIGERCGKNGKTSGVIPFIRVMDSLTLAVSQGSLRRGSAAVYLPVWHPEIEEFIEIRRPTGGDPNRKALNLHHGVLIPDAFMQAVEKDEEWALVSPKDGSVIRKISARGLWIRILTARMEQGEPYIVYSDHVNNARPEHHKLAGLEVKTSNLCSEITLPTGVDHHGKDRTAVCCLSSLNLETWDEWHDNPQFIEDVMLFLDNVLQDFIDRAPDDMAKAKYAAMRERSVGLGVMGFHSFLQAKNVPFESVIAKVWNRKIFKHIREQADAASRKIADLRGPCPDAADFGIHERFSHKMAIAPTASISIIAGSTSPGIEPIAANVFLQKTLAGSFTVRNRHLTRLLKEKGKDTPEVWSSITTSKGSVQHLDFLTQQEKDVFKTAFELDQRWVIEHAADRQPFICQAQSVNLFLPADVHKRDLHALHYQAWKKGLKSLYYCRSLSIQRADTVSNLAEKVDILSGVNVSATSKASSGTPRDYDECLSCQ